MEAMLHRLEEVDIERADGVDRPATRRVFLLAKSEDSDELKVNAERLAEDANKLAQIGKSVVAVLANAKLTLSEEEASVLNMFAKMLDVDHDFSTSGDAEPVVNNGGDMKMRPAKEVETEEEEVEEEEVEESEEEEVVEKAKAKKPAYTKAPKGTSGPPKVGTGKMPKKSSKVRTMKDEEAESEEDEADIDQSDLDERVSASVARALEEQLSPILMRLEEVVTGSVSKSENRRPVSKQADGQDKVEKSAPKAVGEGVFRNIVFN